MKNKKSDLIGKNIKISYNSTYNEVSTDVGVLYSIDTGFFVIKLKTGLLKWIDRSKIVRVEQLEGIDNEL